MASRSRTSSTIRPRSSTSKVPRKAYSHSPTMCSFSCAVWPSLLPWRFCAALFCIVLRTVPSHHIFPKHPFLSVSFGLHNGLRPRIIIAIHVNHRAESHLILDMCAQGKRVHSARKGQARPHPRLQSRFDMDRKRQTAGRFLSAGSRPVWWASRRPRQATQRATTRRIGPKQACPSRWRRRTRCAL